MATLAKTSKAKAPAKAAAKNKAKKTAARKPRKTNPSTEFVLHAPEVGEIFLAGDFNGWENNSVKFRMRKFKGDIWKKKVPLKPGRYEYQFVVDGSWWSDPENSERTKSPFGSENSVVTVG